jgi:Barstar (barnase inhibitor)
VTLIPGVHEVSAEDVHAAAVEGSNSGATVFVLSSEGASSRADFFDAVRTGLRLDPPLIGSKSWDAFSDSLWSGIDGVDSSVVVITWRELQTWAGTHPKISLWQWPFSLT